MQSHQAGTVRTGILGGTFDPIHIGHLETALATLDALQLQRVLLVPAHIPPHRSTAPLASPFHRFAMTVLATKDHASLLPIDLELRSVSPSYTARTLEQLMSGSAPGSQFFFIVGADAFAEIDSWWRYPEVLDLCHFVVVSRPGHPATALPARLAALADRMLHVTSGVIPSTDSAQPRIFLLDVPTPDVSSTDIRQRAARGASIDRLTPDPVIAHIHKHGLYRAASPAVDLQEPS